MGAALIVGQLSDSETVKNIYRKVCQNHSKIYFAKTYKLYKGNLKFSCERIRHYLRTLKYPLKNNIIALNIQKVDMCDIVYVSRRNHLTLADLILINYAKHNNKRIYFYIGE